jgi:hypothetical protein
MPLISAHLSNSKGREAKQWLGRASAYWGPEVDPVKFLVIEIESHGQLGYALEKDFLLPILGARVPLLQGESKAEA